MKEQKRCLCTFSFYDQRAIQEKLEEMAEKGWMLEKMGGFFWTYKRTEPKKLLFSVTYFPDASDFDPGPTEGELTKIDYCRQDGWNLVTSRETMQIFCNEDLNAVPIETEPVTQVENIRRSMKKNIFLPQGMLCGVLLLNFITRFPRWKQDPVEALSNPLSLYLALMYGTLILGCLCEMGYYLHWSRKAAEAAQSNGVFLPVRGGRTASRIWIAISLLLMFLVCNALKGPLGFALLWVCVVPVIIIAGNLVKKQMKKREFPREVTHIAVFVSITLLTVLLIGIIAAFVIRGGWDLSSGKTAVGTYELYGNTRQIYDDPLPLEIEDLAEVSARWSKEADHQETVLLSRAEYCQYAVPGEGDGGAEANRLEYAVTEVKWDFLYDFVKQAAVNSRQDEVGRDYVFTNHYEPVDPALWNADDAYRLHWSSSVMNVYLVFWGNRIVEITFYWEPTPEQIAVAAQKLGDPFNG